MGTKGLRNAAIFTFLLSMAILLLGGYFAFDKKPPIPERVLSAGKPVGEPPIDGASIRRGQDVYQRYGLMDHGSVWGHGSLRGMDFSAHTLHATGMLARRFHASEGKPAADAHSKLAADLRQGAQRRRELDAADAAVIAELRRNRYSEATKTLELTPAQAYVVEQIRGFWDAEFGQGDPDYGFLPNTVPTKDERRDLADFFFWTSWAAGTNRLGPDGQQMSYTLHEQLALGSDGREYGLHRGVGVEHRLDPRPVPGAGDRGLRGPPLGVLLRRIEGGRGGLPPAGDARHAQPAGQREVLPHRRAVVRGADLQRRAAGPLHGAPGRVLREVRGRNVPL